MIHCNTAMECVDMGYSLVAMLFGLRYRRDLAMMEFGGFRFGGAKLGEASP